MDSFDSEWDFVKFFLSQSQIVAAEFSSLARLKTESAILSGTHAEIKVTVPDEDKVGGEVGGYELIVHSILLGN